MIDGYVLEKTVEALKEADGDKHAAQKILIAWAVRDQNLMLGMVKPHLKGIAAALLEHVKLSQHPRVPNPAEYEGDRIEKSEIEKALAKKPISGRRGQQVPPPKTSQRQANAMHQLAAAYQKKKK